MSFSLNEILKWTQGELFFSKGREISFEDISIDSRSIKKGGLFLAIPGKRFDGHNYLNDVFSKGAKGAIVSSVPENFRQSSKSAKFVLIKVKNSLGALQALAFHYRRKFKLKVVAVTGSNGKTTTKDLISHILQKSDFLVFKSPGNFNNQIGLPLNILKLQKDYEFAVLELGASALGEIGLLSRLAKPQIGVITNVGLSHLEFLGRVENVAKAKQELIEFLDKEGLAVLNNDDAYVSKMRKRVKGKVVTFGMKGKVDFRASDISCENFSNLSFKINKRIKLSLRLLGRHNVYNVLAACAVSRCLGLNWDFIKHALADFTPPEMRMELKQINGLNVINDAYNANPHSMKAALASVVNLKSKGRKILVFGDMLELGQFSRRAHRQLGEEIGKSGIDYLLTVGESSRLTAQGAIRSRMSAGRIFHSSSVEKVVPLLKNIARKEDIILIKGSRSMELERIVEGIENAL